MHVPWRSNWETGLNLVTNATVATRGVWTSTGLRQCQDLPSAAAILLDISLLTSMLFKDVYSSLHQDKA